MDYKEITKKSYEITAEEYTANVATLAPMQSIKSFINLLPQGGSMIEIGCGSGRDAKHFSESGLSVTGVDFCSNLINIAKKAAPLATFYLMDIESLTFPDAAFDGAWASCSLLHLPKKAIPAVFKNIHRILKENGYFYFNLKHGSGEVLERDSRYSGHFEKFWSYYEEGEIRELLKESNFHILDLRYVEKNHDYQSHSSLAIFCQKK